MNRGIAGLMGIIAAMIAVGTYGFHLYEGWSLYESFYFVVVTLTTVGYGDLVPTTPQGRLVALLFLLFGVGAVLTIIPLVFSYFIERGIRSALGVETTPRMKDHIILCWYNAFSDQAMEDIGTHGIPYMVIEKDEEAVSRLRDLGIPYVRGDPGDELSLKKASIEDASTIILASRKDSENVFTTIAAKNLNPGIRVIARVNSEETIPILRRVGADTIIDPQEITFVTLVNSALSPYAADLLDKISLFKDINLGQFQVAADSQVAGQTIAETRFRDRTGASIVAIWMKDEMHPNPPADTILEENYVLLVLGTDTQLKKAKALVEGHMEHREVVERKKEIQARSMEAANEIRVRMPKVLLNLMVIFGLFVAVTVVMPSLTALMNLIPHGGGVIATILPLMVWMVIGLITFSMLEDIRILLNVMSGILAELLPGKTNGKGLGRALKDIIYAGIIVLLLAIVSPFTSGAPALVRNALSVLAVALPIFFIYDASTILYRYLSIVVDRLSERIAGEVERR